MMQKSPLKSRFANDIIKTKGGFAMNFISVFAICLIVSYVLLFFFGSFVLGNIFAAMAVFAFIAAIFITVSVSLSDKIEKLEKRISELEAHSTEKSSE